VSERLTAAEVARFRPIWHDSQTIVRAMENVTSPDSCIPAERQLLPAQQGMQQPGLLHSCVPSAQDNSTPMFGMVGDKTECATAQRSRPIARDRHERVKARDKRLAHDTGTRKMNCDVQRTVAQSRGWRKG
jgi:hypothetical protein